MYDKNNIFAKIIRKELPAKIIEETNDFLCFEDIAKASPTHWLVVPKTKDRNFSEFVSNNPPETISNFYKFIQNLVKKYNLEEQGYRLITNCGESVGQTVFHFHVHVMSGKKLSSKLA